MIRSSQPRITYKAHAIAPKNTKDIKAGMVSIGNDLAGQYKGELQIALKDRPKDGRQNILVYIAEENLILLQYLKVWHSFTFRQERK
nr:DUF871 domain-containing protein [Streptococcus catagoni]